MAYHVPLAPTEFETEPGALALLSPVDVTSPVYVADGSAGLLKVMSNDAFVPTVHTQELWWLSTHGVSEQ